MPRARRTLFATAAIALAVPAASSAQPIDAQLQGTFTLSGRVTAAAGVHGEHVGQAVSRTWTFTPVCSIGICATVTLVRQRAGGTDTLKLHRHGTGNYDGRGRFYAPLQCGRRVYQHGEAVPFTVTVRITAATQTTAGPVASAITATYTNLKRTNLTPCVVPPSHDAAVYSGVLSSQSPAGT
jgi:hypothetical protein